MTFLQPWLLIALPLICIPIVIHLVNQWRYQTKPWAAMIFLLQAKSMHRGMAKVRQWLILAMRTLAVAGLIFAVSRPLASGVLGKMAGGSVETTLVLLDRSPSMQQQGVNSNETKLETGLRQLQEALRYRQSQRWILIDSVTPKEPRVFESLSELLKASRSTASATSTDWPSLCQTASSYLQNNPTAAADVWLCSDMQRSDWQTESATWSAITTQFQKLPGRVRFMVMAFSEKPTNDFSVRVEKVSCETVATGRELVLDVEVQSHGPSEDGRRIPVEFTIENGRFQVEVELVQGSGRLQDYRLTLDSSTNLTGWGRARIPLDDNDANNSSYFAFSPTPPRSTTIVCDHKPTMESMAIAAGISPTPQTTSQVRIITSDLVSSIQFDNDALVVWQAPLPTGTTLTQLEQFVDGGGSLWFFPPSSLAEQNAVPDPQAIFRGFRWLRWEALAAPIQPQTWRFDQGVLATSQSGMSLPVGELKIQGYARWEGDATSLATLSNDQPLLAKLNDEHGHVLIWSTLPNEPSSTLSKNGIVLFVAAQRALQEGSARQLPILELSATGLGLDIAGVPLPPRERWESLANDERFLSTEVGAHAGVHVAGNRLIAINRPLTEDIFETVSQEAFDKAFDGLDVFRIEELAGSKRQIQQEIWRTFLMLMIAALLLEASLSLPRSSRNRISTSHPAKNWSGS